MRPGRRPPLRLLLAGAGVLLVAVVAVILLASGGGSGERLTPFAEPGNGTRDPLAYAEDRRAAFERRAAEGLAHVLYAKSPGGAVATAKRTARWRGLVQRVAGRYGLDPDLLEALVFLESGGRPDARASSDLNGAAGLTQILAETGRNLLKMRIDVTASERLTRGIARGHKVAERTRLRRRVDERFDPAKALAATGRYLDFARGLLHRDDLAFVSYHMGVGNLQDALRAYGEQPVPYARLFFDSTPLRHAQAWALLARLGDDSSTYLWRLLAAREIMRLWRADPAALRRLAALQTARNSAEEVLHPPGSTEVFADPAALLAARASGALVPLTAGSLGTMGLRLDATLGELAGRLHVDRARYRALRPAARALLRYLGLAVRDISGLAPLSIDSAVRDARYQRMLAHGNPQATRRYSLHTTGFAFDIRRRYRDRAQARAFQFTLDRLTALNLITWVREPAAIHVTVAGDAGRVLSSGGL